MMTNTSLIQSALNRFDATPRMTMALLRVVWLALMLFSLAVFVVTLPSVVALRSTICTADSCLNGLSGQITTGQVSAAGAEALARAGIPLPTYAVLVTLLGALHIVFNYILAVILMRQQSDNTLAVLTAYALVGCSIAGRYGPLRPLAALDPAHWLLPLNFMFSISWGVVLPIGCLLPDGKIKPGWAKWVAILGFFYIQYEIYQPIVGISPILFKISGAAIFFCILGIQVYRYRTLSLPQERENLRLLYFLIVTYTLITGTMSLLPVVIPELQSATSLWKTVIDNVLSTLAFVIFMPLFGLAILYARLLDTDLLIRRTVIYSALTTAVVGVYVFVTSVLGAMFRASSGFIVSLIATGVIVVLFAPLRTAIERLFTRFLFGDRDTPHVAMSRLSAQFEASTSPETLLSGMAEMVAQGFKVPYVSIAVKTPTGFRPEAVFGRHLDQGRMLTLPLVYGQETVGHLAIGQDKGDKPLNEAHYKLLENMARQVAAAVHALQLNEALQLSRAHIVNAREEERLRLRRDLHDGLGPTLGAYTLMIGSIRALYSIDPAKATAMLDDLETGLSNALGEVRRLVYNLRPPALDQLGFIGALHDYVNQAALLTNHQVNPLTVKFHTPEALPRLPAAVEVALYRIVQEGLTNIIRHAQATTCEITLAVTDGLSLTLTDNGIGLPAQYKQGVGLSSMRERAEELGGHFLIERCATGGTHLRVWLPLQPAPIPNGAL